MHKAEDVTRMRHMLDAARKALEFTQKNWVFGSQTSI